MKFSLTIDCDNAAFDDGVGDELARILTKFVKDDLVGGNLDGFEGSSLYDTNGNRVGAYSLTGGAAR